ncbi:extracellular solute-binding protein [Paenibacillus whitsoniae]|uniref:Extracellular solute-binding protein n=1 Tax=Paenibacillus whitsoniae TaxID=2496558 RepID=A0A430J677_9BACL|nr:extracellular solute-binding protein [Paenibacillus whitsoniae]RTE04228.1 extracellular solute-binding protein [Paenibacillus whitsoniae]
MSKKKAQSMTVASVLTLAMITGCSSNNDTSSSPSAASTSTAAATKQPTATLKLAVLETYPGVTLDNKTTHYIEEKTNTKLDITVIPSGDLENKLQVMLASGDKPDIIQLSTDTLEMKLTKSNVLLPLNTYFDKAPNLKKFGDGGLWDIMKHNDNNVYTIPIRGSAIDNIPIYRKDWLDKVGLKVPTTLDEYYAVADAFTNKDPDGNGKKDTYALSAYTAGGNVDLSSMDMVFSAFGTLPGNWILQDGKLVPGAVAPGALDALKFLNKMYKEKMIDPEFITDNAARFKDKVIKGTVGAPVYRYFLMDTSNINNYYTPLKQNNPNAEFVEGGILKGPKQNGIGYRMLTQRGWLKTAITKDSKNIDAAIRVLDFLASDEGNMYENYGEKGKDYTLDNNIVKQLIKDEEIKAAGIGQLKLAFNFMYNHTSQRFQELYKFAHTIGYRNPADGLVIDDNSKATELGQFTSQQFTKMILNEGPIDDLFKDFVTEFYKRGGTDYTKAMNDAYLAKTKK